jgi:mannose-6-phosphate isomerase-like protein (cupin superfamily)
MEIINIEKAEHYTWGKICDGWHLLKSDGLSVIQERVPPGGAEILHFHEQSHQFFFVLAGEATMEIEGELVLIGVQQGLSIPPKMAHRLLNNSREDVSFLVISAPKSHGDRVQLNQPV